MKKNGFTIVEVALVLAIAGLIFLMIFVALPTLQRNQRDAERRDDIAVFLDALKKFQNNNRGALPSEGGNITSDRAEELVNKDVEKPGASSWENLYYSYLNNSFMDPSGEGYGLKVVEYDDNTTNELPEDDANKYVLIVAKQATCDGAKAKKSSNPRKIAVMYKLEGSGVYCANT